MIPFVVKAFPAICINTNKLSIQLQYIVDTVYGGVCCGWMPIMGDSQPALFHYNVGNICK